MIKVIACKIYIFQELAFGLHLHKISNKELVESFNTYVEIYNRENLKKLTDGIVKALEPSSAEFIS